MTNSASLPSALPFLTHDRAYRVRSVLSAMEIEQEDAGTDPSASTGSWEGAAQFQNGDSPTKIPPPHAADGIDSHGLGSDISIASDSDSDGSNNDDLTRGSPCEPAAGNAGENMRDGREMVSKKRKSPGTDSDNSELGDQSTAEAYKKARLDHAPKEPPVSNARVSDKSLLPPEIWHHIFTFCPPKTLGNLLSVNKLFHQYLNPSPSTQIECPSSASPGVLSVLKPNYIWQSSRRSFWPHMPAPLRSMSELSMWMLLCSTKCQECNKTGDSNSKIPAGNLLDGPGLGDVTVIWPFAIRVCGPCLLRKAIKVRCRLLARL